MNIYDKISEQDREKLEHYIISFGGFDECRGVDCSMKAPLETVLREYLDKKQDLFKLFGEELILTKEINYTKSIDEVIDSIRSNENIRDFINHYANQITSYYEDYYPIYRKLRRLFNWQDIATNKYSDESFEFINPFKNDGKVIKIQHGMKITRIFNKLQETLELNKNLLENFRLAHSRILNDKTLKGELSLSIHPLDFITMSDNASNWSSCMSWIHGGGYRGGTVEMMNSPIVVMAYLNGSTPFKFQNYTWNNKKWRCLFIVEQDIICSVKSYPYYQDALIDTCVDWIAELARKNWNADFNPSTKIGKTNSSYILYDNTGKEFANKGYIDFTTDGHSMYNDFGNAINHHYLITENLVKWFENQPENYSTYIIDYAGDLTCMTCGNYCVDVGYEGEVLCHDCYSPARCCKCGEILIGESIIVDGYAYCENCYDDLFAYDELEGQSIDSLDSIEIRVEPAGSYIVTHEKNVTDYWEYWFTEKPKLVEEAYVREYIINIKHLTLNSLAALPSYFTRQYNAEKNTEKNLN